MPFVQARCPECGGMLAVNNEKRAAICQFCNEPFVIQDAINNYNTYNNYDNRTTHNYGQGAVVNIYEDSSREFVIEAGVLKEYHGKDIDVVIPDGVIKISETAFRGSCIRSVVIPNSVKELSFSGCEHLVSVTIPNGVKEICFSNCKSLEAVKIPNGVTKIWYECFINCCNLKSVEIPDSVTEIGARAFINCISLKSIRIPGSVECIDCGVFGGCESLETVIIENGVEAIVGSAYGFVNLKRLELPDSIKVIGGGSIPPHFNIENLGLSVAVLARNRHNFDAYHRSQVGSLLKKKGLCLWCGGEFKQGFLSSKCTKCGRPKTY